MDAEEDLYHEFKGHRSFAMEEVPMIAITNRTRRSISRYSQRFIYIHMFFFPADNDFKIMQKFLWFSQHWKGWCCLLWRPGHWGSCRCSNILI